VNRLDTFSKPGIIELFPLRPPNRVACRTLYVGERLKGSDWRNRHEAVQDRKQNHCVHLILAERSILFNATRRRPPEVYSDPCKAAVRLQEDRPKVLTSRFQNSIANFSFFVAS